MDTIISLYAGASGLWKKVSAYLPLVLGAGSVLTGLGGILGEFGHAANAGAFFALAQNLQHDPNAALVIAGLAALGIHTNHTGNVAAIASASGVPLAIAGTQDAPPAAKP